EAGALRHGELLEYLAALGIDQGAGPACRCQVRPRPAHEPPPRDHHRRGGDYEDEIAAPPPPQRAIRPTVSGAMVAADRLACIDPLEQRRSSRRPARRFSNSPGCDRL